jgi:hypothetical protein
MATGYNSPSKEEAKEAISSYLVMGSDWEKDYLENRSLEDICNSFEFELEESEIEFEEEQNDF